MKNTIDKNEAMLGLMQKSCSADKSTHVCGIISGNLLERMRGDAQHAAGFPSVLDNGKEQTNTSLCRISAITHILETGVHAHCHEQGADLRWRATPMRWF